ncbi:MAG: AAA family ATPase, partial [Candidatus Competibacteraceae bacterium]|nr:AAA family ATPase [Candidatus Competibacteraceae bacterium]
MIESITIASTATFGTSPEMLNGLSQFNFVFGSNGTGKTTVSRVIADENSFPSCQVIWKGGTKLETMVYNRDFVDRNFHQPTELKGVFTLGEDQVDTRAKIKTAKAELDDLTKEIEEGVIQSDALAKIWVHAASLSTPCQYASHSR